MVIFHVKKIYNIVRISREKNIQHKTIEKLTLEIQEVHDRQEELRLAKQVRNTSELQ